MSELQPLAQASFLSFPTSFFHLYSHYISPVHVQTTSVRPLRLHFWKTPVLYVCFHSRVQRFNLCYCFGPHPICLSTLLLSPLFRLHFLFVLTDLLLSLRLHFPTTVLSEEINWPNLRTVSVLLYPASEEIRQVWPGASAVWTEQHPWRRMFSSCTWHELLLRLENLSFCPKFCIKCASWRQNIEYPPLCIALNLKQSD